MNSGNERPQSIKGTVLLIIVAALLGMGLFAAFVAGVLVYDGLLSDD